jgi:signal transduction histidine kinase
LSGRHLLSLINVILDLSKIEAQELTANFESFNIQNIIEDVLKIVWLSANNKGLSLSIVKTPQIGEIFSDKLRIQQVLINMVDNAIKFTEKGSVSIGCYKDKDSVKIEVSDTGIGIKEEDLSCIFNPFIQIDNKLTRKYEGSGLGLSISEKLMELLHGTINVKSEVGVGSTFTITLPLKIE